jgi:hypothetical protein
LQSTVSQSWGDTVPGVAKLLGGLGLLPFLYYGYQHDPLPNDDNNHLASDVKATTPRMDVTIDRWLQHTPAALIPLLTAAKSGDQLTVRRRFITYGGSILSFMGAVHWGLAMAAPTPRPSQYIVSVVPALLAWTALNVSENTLAPHAILGTGFLGIYLYDEVMLSRKLVPAWYTYLRSPLSVIVLFTVTGSAYISRDRRTGMGPTGRTMSRG